MSVAKRLANGAAWKFGSTGGIASLAMISQFVLGWLLSEHDFGVYALAISSAALVQVAKDGGVRLTLIRLTPQQFRKQARTGALISVSTSLLIALILAAASRPVATFFNEVEVGKLLRLLAASLPLAALAPIAVAGLSVGMHFRAVSLIQLTSALIRYGSTIAFALAGFGPMSFVLPLFLVNSFESVAGWLALRRSGLSPNPGFVAPNELLRVSPWVVLGSWVTFLYLSADNLVLGRLLSTAAVGLYFFGYQIVGKLAGAFDALSEVLLPGFAAIGSDQDRTSRAIEALGLVAGALTGALFMVIANVAGPLVSVVWNGRWDGAVGTIRALALAMPAFVLVRFVEMHVQARGRFALWSLLVGVRAVTLATAAWIGSSLVVGSAPTNAAIVIGLTIALVSLFLAGVGTSVMGVGWRYVFRRFIAPYVFVVACAFAFMAVERLLDPMAAPVRLAAIAGGSMLILYAGFRWILTGTASALRPILALLPGGRVLAMLLAPTR